MSERSIAGPFGAHYRVRSHARKENPILRTGAPPHCCTHSVDGQRIHEPPPAVPGHLPIYDRPAVVFIALDQHILCRAARARGRRMGRGMAITKQRQQQQMPRATEGGRTGVGPFAWKARLWTCARGHVRVSMCARAYACGHTVRDGGGRWGAGAIGAIGALACETSVPPSSSSSGSSSSI